MADSHECVQGRHHHCEDAECSCPCHSRWRLTEKWIKACTLLNHCERCKDQETCHYQVLQARLSDVGRQR